MEEVLMGAAAAAVMATAGAFLLWWSRKKGAGLGKRPPDSAPVILTPVGRSRRKMGQFQAEVIRYTYM